jgi:hypothetical protein
MGRCKPAMNLIPCWRLWSNKKTSLRFACAAYLLESNIDG